MFVTVWCEVLTEVWLQMPVSVCGWVSGSWYLKAQLYVGKYRPHDSAPHPSTAASSYFKVTCLVRPYLTAGFPEIKHPKYIYIYIYINNCIFIQFHILGFFENLSRKLKLDQNSTRITGTLDEDLGIFMIISRWVLLRMTNVSEKIYGENKIHIIYIKSSVIWIYIHDRRYSF